MFGALVVTLVLHASAAPQKLAEAKKLADELQYDRAVKVIDAGLAQPEIDRDTLLGLYELAALSWANLDKPAKAREAFQLLLSLKPDYELSKDLPPRTRTPFFEAKTWLAGTTPVSVDVQSIVEAGKLTGLSIVVMDNVLVKVKAVRVTITPPGGAAQTLTPPLQVGRATVALGEDGGAWRVDLQGERGVLLSSMGETKRYLPPVVAPPVEVVKAPQPPPTKWQQTAGFVVGAVGLVGTIGGVAAGLVSSQARARIATSERNPMGVVTGLTQREAAQLDATARTTGLVANVLLIAGGALLAGGVVLFILGLPADAPASASLSVTPGGLVFSGAF
ncbi:MAG: hypothetical protein JNJ54_28395 [Myxococcaceae bacterium]|nr:hypothetical protein [Myxococcaceae bacterium]